MVECPRCFNLTEFWIFPDCKLCKNKREVSSEVFIRWKFRNKPHKTIRFDGQDVSVVVEEFDNEPTVL